MNKNVMPFPSKENRPKHVYEFDSCAGCGKEIADNERFTEVVMTDVDGMRKKHIALCEKCEGIAEGFGVFD